MTLSLKYTDRIFEVLKSLSQKADYWDVRIGEGSGTVISFRSKVLEQLSFPKSFGGSVRVLVKGGWGFVTFRDIDELPSAAEKALSYARLVGKGKSNLAPVPPVKEIVTADREQKDFLKVETKEKINLLEHYRDLLWQKKTALVQSQLIYIDNLSNRLFVSSPGSVIEQELPTFKCYALTVAKKASVVQQYAKRLPSANFADFRGQDEGVKKAVDVANQLVDASPAQSGEFPIVMDGLLAGTFAHEAFGHLSEADSVEKDEQLRKIMQLGRKFGSEKITIYDDPSVGRWPLYKYDDEGTLAVRAVLLNRGVLVGRLHSRETAGVLGETPNGHGRAEGVGHKPIVRMGMTVIAPGESERQDLFKGIKKGYYCVSWSAGMTDHENFTFAAAYGYEINNGKLGRMIRDLKISGNLFQTLQTIEGVGKDSAEEPGTCGKMDQNVPVSTIAPHVRLGKAQVLGVNK